MEAFKSGPYTIEQKDGQTFVIPRQGGMRTSGVIFVDKAMFRAALADGCPIQVANVAHLPGIVGPAMAMPDVHSGYGFPIGGVAAFDAEDGIVSPGGVGYDINCGVRLLLSRVERDEIRGRETNLLDRLSRNIPAGVGSKRSDLKNRKKLFHSCMADGARAAVDAGFGVRDDLTHIEGMGRLEGADPGRVSAKAIERGVVQLGTLGSGNHFVEVGYVDRIFDDNAAAAFGLSLRQVTAMVHTGSRGFGHQVCDDAVRAFRNAPEFTALGLPDRQLCCVPIRSPRGEAYLAAMAAAANFAFANRQIITHLVREAFGRELRPGGSEMRLDLLYDLTHNIARFEEHDFEGKRRRLLVHRKGATRAFPPGRPELEDSLFREWGQPVIVPGDMGRYSYVLVGQSRGTMNTFASSCHGAGRVMSRGQARARETAGRVLKQLENQGIQVRAASKKTLAEEGSAAYKDVAHVIGVMQKAGIARPVARLKPLLVVKG